jgi:uncharacterized protein (TIGR02246 family)
MLWFPRSFAIVLPTTFVALLAALPALAQQNADEAAVRASGQQLVAAFNAGKAADVAALFLPEGELIDEHGKVYAGRQPITELLTKFFARFPNAKVNLEVDSLRVVGPVAIEEGTRLTTTADNQQAAEIRYLAVRTKVGNNWLLAQLRDLGDQAPPTPHEQLQPLAWLVGKWVNESSDAAVSISYAWSEDRNFLLGDFLITRGGSLVMKSSQRIGWDPLTGKVRSWMFDSDGGYAEGHWTFADGAWVIKSSAVMPDGRTGSATVTLTPQGPDHYLMKGTDRLVGDAREEDFEVKVARQAPAPSK